MKARNWSELVTWQSRWHRDGQLAAEYEYYTIIIT